MTVACFLTDTLNWQVLWNKEKYLLNSLFEKLKNKVLVKPALQIRAGQRSITASLRFLTAHIYQVMIIVTGGFSKKSFFIIFTS